jgi:iron complex transport system permease protein
MKRRPLTWAALLALASLFLAPLVGTVSIDLGTSLRELFTSPSAEWSAETRILSLRLPRVLLAWLGGGGLAVAGAAMQTLLRNGLATPYTLGVSSAGTFGAFLCLAFPTLGAYLILPRLAALVCALGVTFLVLAVARRSPRPDGLILAGVTLNFLFGAAVMLVRYLADPYQLAGLDRWLMGALDVVGFEVPLSLLPWLAVGLFLLLRRATAFDQYAFDPGLAAARGVDAQALRRDGLFAASLLAAAIVASCGPIGFIGLLIPHAVRAGTGMRHQRLFVGSFLLGAAFLTAADALARSLALFGRSSEIPVGIVTALVGGPFFLWLLLRRAR